MEDKLQEQDRVSLEFAKMNKKMATLMLEKAAAQNEAAEVSYKYLVLQIYMKYGLSPKDGIDENGNIIRGDSGNESDWNL